jgi:glycerol-3-phosphate dehydrogenase
MVGVISRDPAAAAATTYDLIVIGGGVYGVAIAHQASRLGQRALLLEQDDFGGATTGNSLRILHWRSSV